MQNRVIIHPDGTVTIDMPVMGPIHRPCDKCGHKHGVIAQDPEGKLVHCIDCGVEHQNSKEDKGNFQMEAHKPLGKIEKVEHIYPGLLRFTLTDVDWDYWKKVVAAQEEEARKQAPNRRRGS